jgi:hypothetical protein
MSDPTNVVVGMQRSRFTLYQSDGESNRNVTIIIMYRGIRVNIESGMETHLSRFEGKEITQSFEKLISDADSSTLQIFGQD